MSTLMSIQFFLDTCDNYPAYVRTMVALRSAGFELRGAQVYFPPASLERVRTILGSYGLDCTFIVSEDNEEVPNV